MTTSQMYCLTDRPAVANHNDNHVMFEKLVVTRYDLKKEVASQLTDKKS